MKNNGFNTMSHGMNDISDISDFSSNSMKIKKHSIFKSVYFKYALFTLVIFILIFIIVYFDPFGWFNKSQNKEVFHVDSNKDNFTFDQAHLVCKSLNSELATMDQMYHSVKNGANWNEQGWIKEQVALYPVKNSNDNGILQGGYFSNEKEIFGVNCYGLKPNNINFIKQEPCTIITEEDRKYNDILKIPKKLAPFNKNKWSEYK
jgi:hypothetical protein